MNVSYNNLTEAKEAGIEYMLLIGRRQPWHIGHLQSWKDVINAGFKPIFVIGSANSAYKQNGFPDPRFNPIDNPLSPHEQRAFIKFLMKDEEHIILESNDIGNIPLWTDELIRQLPPKTAMHVIGKPGEGFWNEKGGLREKGIPIIECPPHADIPLELSARQLRKLDLNNLTTDQSFLFASSFHITELALKARKTNKLIDDIPVTMLDVSAARLIQEKSIPAEEFAGVTNLEELENKIRELSAVNNIEAQKIKIASAALNQTVYDLANNVKNICDAIDKAVEDGADILALPELCLTGYSADDYHNWFRNDIVFPQIEYIAKYAAAKNPNLVLSLGTPWIHFDKSKSADSAEYNINNKPFNTQWTISGGKIIAIAAKSILAVGAAEYENHQFNNWPVSEGTIAITLPNGERVPFGKPLIKLGNTSRNITLFTEQCAEGWPGVNDDLTIIHKEQAEARYLANLSKNSDIGVVINPSASRPQPAINKEKIRKEGLCKTGSQLCGVYAYINYLGSESATYAAEGSQIFAQNGEIIHCGSRYSFDRISYSSVVVDVPVTKKTNTLIGAMHNFTDHAPATIGNEAEFEKANGDDLVYEEYARSIALWLRDYLSKQSWNAQGYVISLSGGADSAYGAVCLSNMVDLTIKELGVEGFFEFFPNLKCKEDALNAEFHKSTEAAAEVIKHHMFTYVYLPSENSSQTTLNAARTLIEGGNLPDGNYAKGIGGKFEVHNIQPSFESYLISHASLDISKAIADSESDKSRPFWGRLLGRIVKSIPIAGLYSGWMEFIIKKEIMNYVNSPLGSNPILPNYISRNCLRRIPTWANKSDDITLQNYQARTRLPIPWAVANQEGKIALVTSNASEAAAGYTTAGGDMHMGGANPIGGIPKETLKKSLRYFADSGLTGLNPIKALHYINVQKPTAELRREEEGVAKQTDESDLGFNYAQLEAMARVFITGRKTAKEGFDTLRYNNLFSSDTPELRKIIIKFLDHRWPAAQFKRVFGAIAPYVGDSLDPHQSVRTTILGDHFKTQLAHLTLDIIAEKLGSNDNFRKLFLLDLDEAKALTSRNGKLKSMLIKLDLPIDKICSERGSFLASEINKMVYEEQLKLAKGMTA